MKRCNSPHPPLPPHRGHLSTMATGAAVEWRDSIKFGVMHHRINENSPQPPPPPHSTHVTDIFFNLIQLILDYIYFLDFQMSTLNPQVLSCVCTAFVKTNLE